ncbi:MAG: ParB N-terminal domain-containing protein [Wenzhouxiangellaceae bacterium]|nr:ParB N-terminal domain-containing protein [Wenzhouxiangellaceae bacterium]
MRTLNKALSWLRNKDIKVIEGLDLSADTHAYLATLPYWVGRSPIIYMPTSLLVMQGAFSFGEQHPFVRTIACGRNELAAFYKNFQPKNLAQMYRLPEPARGGDLAPWELPWLLRRRRPSRGEKGLAPAHGVSYYGPCTDAKIDLETSRLAAIAKSIAKRGYRQPPLLAHIAGHFMQSGDEIRFFVRGGKHRAAALTALGFEHVPVRMRDTWPRLVSRDQAAHWPLVRSGEISRSFACRIFDRYFE